MPRFHELIVTDVQKTIRDAVVVTLQPANGGDFSFTQGQYLTFRRDFDGTELRRSYSICAGRTEGFLQVGIKQVDGGAFSTWANEALQPGMTMEAMEPMGSFHTPLEPGRPKRYLAFAGGSGITPVLSILKTVLAEEPHCDFTLVYANRGVNTIMFREELEDLKNRYLGRLTIIHILESDALEVDLFQGRVDRQKCTDLFQNLIAIETIDTAFICGPEPMMLEIAAALREQGLTDAQIKFELFASAQPGKLARREIAKKGTGKAGDLIQATVNMDGASRSFEMAKDVSILDAALANAMDAPFACRAGVCSTCKCRILEGEVEMVANHALEDYEVELGYVLSCQSYVVTERVVVDYDQ